MLSNDCIEHAHLLRGDGPSIYWLVAVVAMVYSDHGARVDLSVVYGVAMVASVLIDLGDLIPAYTRCPRTFSYYMNCSTGYGRNTDLREREGWRTWKSRFTEHSRQ